MEDEELLHEVTTTNEAARRDRARAFLDQPTEQDLPQEPPEASEGKGVIKSIQGGVSNMMYGTYLDPGSTKAVLGDIGKGATEAPVQIAAGVMDATREVLELANEADNWIADQTGYWPALNLENPMKRGLIVNKADEENEQGLGSEIPKLRYAESATGNVIRGGAQFLVPFGAASKLAKGIKVTSRMGRFAKFTALGAVVDFSAFDPFEARLSDLMAEMPTGQARPFFEWMATEDSALEGRVKNMIEGGIIGSAFAGLFELGGAVVRGRKVRAEAIRAGDVGMSQQVEGAAEAVRREAAEAEIAKALDDVIGDAEPSQIAAAKRELESAVAGDADIATEGSVLRSLIDDNQAQEVIERVARVASETEPPRAVSPERIDELIGPEDVLRTRTAQEEAVDSIEALPAMAARKQAAEMTGETYRSKADAIEGVRLAAGGDEKPYINTRMIEGPEDLIRTVRNLADEYSSEVAQGTRTTDSVIADARDVKDFAELSKTRPERLTDAEQYAVREMWASSARQVRNLAEQAAISTDPVIQYAFRRTVTMHRSIQAYAFEARAAAARQLRQWAIPVGETPDMLREMEGALQSWGGGDVSQKLAGHIADAYAGGNRAAAEQLVKRGWGAKAMDMLNELGVSAKLYQPSTHLVNMGGNALLMGWEGFNRAVAEGIGVLTQTGVKRGETAAMMRGMMLGVRDGLREARATLRTGQGYAGGNKVELPRQSAFAPARLEMREGTMAARGMKVLSVSVQAPFRALGAADTFFKVVNERSELYAQAMRAAVREGGDDLATSKQLFARYVDEPTRPMQEAAIKAAQERTFTNPATGGTKHLMNLRSQMGPLGYIMFPFIQTPANILSYAIRSSPAAPTMRRFREAYQAGGAEREMAIARVSTGSLMLAMGYDMAVNGEVTGSGPPIGHPARSAWLRENRPYSLKLDNRTIEFRRADPFGLWLGTAADLHEMFALVDWDDDVQAQADEVFTAIAFSLGNSVMNKTWLTGASDVIEALADPHRYGDSYMQRVLTGFIPSGIKTASRVDDPYARETENIIQAFKAHFGLSEGFPLKRDWLGRTIDRSSGLGATYDFISPIAVKPDRSEPIDQEILRLGWGPSKPQKRISVDGVSVSLRNRLDLYSRYIELSGQVSRGGKTLNEALNAMVTGQGSLGRQYEQLSDGPEGQKRQAIEVLVQTYREAARAQLIQENQAYFAAQIKRRKDRRDQQAVESQSEFAVPG